MDLPTLGSLRILSGFLASTSQVRALRVSGVAALVVVAFVVILQPLAASLSLGTPTVH